MKIKDMKIEREEIERAMLKILLKECEIKIDINQFEPNEYRDMIEKLVLMRSDFNVSEEYKSLEDKLLSCENKSNLLNLSKQKFFGRIKIVEESLIDSNADLLILITYSYFSEDFNSDSVNSKIILKAGLQLKQDLYTEQKKNNFNLSNKSISIVKGRNLNAKYLSIICLPNESDIEDLNLYFSKLVEFTIDNKLKNIVIIIDKFQNDLNFINSIKNISKINKKLKIFINIIK